MHGFAAATGAALSALPAARARAEAAFGECFAATPDVIARAPGRVNLIGEHVDYNDGIVLPMAIDLDVVVCARRRSDHVLYVASLERGETGTIHLNATERPRGWPAYVAGIAAVLRIESGADLVVASDVPQAAGLSSSAAFEAAVALALLALERRELDRTELAQQCRRAEHEWAGVSCGIMDQLAVLCCREAHALLLDCRTLDFEHVPIPEAVRMAITHEGSSRELAASGYNARVQECREAARLLGVAALRDVASAAALDVLPAPLDRRARHVISEIERTRRLAAALRAGNVLQCGALMNASHESLRHDFEVSTSNLDGLVERARAVPGVLGARLTGAGFGGHALAFTVPLALRRLRAAWPSMRPVTPAPGASYG
jgi:galactokinase